MPYLIFIAVMSILAVRYPRLMDAVVYLAIAPFLGLCFGGFTWGLSGLFFPGVVSLAGFGSFILFGTFFVICVLLAIRNS